MCVCVSDADLSNIICMMVYYDIYIYYVCNAYSYMKFLYVFNKIVDRI
jgi:hypothetical protein